MPADEVARVVPDVPPGHPDLAHVARSVAACEWEGVVDGEVRQVHVAGRPVLKGNPAFEGSLFLGNRGRLIEGDPDKTQPVGFGIWRNGKRVATGRAWDGPTDSLIVLFDPDGRVVERAYITIRVESRWVHEIREAVSGFLPF
jgi:hypothetical protein